MAVVAVLFTHAEIPQPRRATAQRMRDGLARIIGA
jgi:hypothetical protein